MISLGAEKIAKNGLNPKRTFSTNSGDISLPQQLFASSVGALLTSLLVTPMDVVKIRLQSQVRPLVKGECFLYSNGLMDHLCRVCEERVTTNGFKNAQKCEWFNRPGHFTGTFDAVIKITRNEGIRSLWSGLSPTMLSAVPATVFYFTLYDNLHNVLRERIGNKSFFAPLLAGSLARASSVTIVSPLELIRTKMQSEKLSYFELISAISRTIRSDGYSALWRGWTATMLRDIPFSAIYWTCYETFKQQSLLFLNVERINFTYSFLFGSLSGAIASIITLPFDVVKTHQQITLGQLNDKKVNFENERISPPLTTLSKKGVFPIFKELIKTKGIKSLFTGLVPRVARVAPACAIMIGSYEHFKTFFADKNKENILMERIK
uniref:Solute carrier family 25 member 40 n=1 Tax=Meloidogyne floridensis TaxID=298350 RepID=A0A915PG19_9BILA